MKSFVLAATLLLTGLATRPAQAHTLASTRLVPRGFCLFGRPTVRPLTRYLVATLHLTHRQAVAVQRTLHGHAAKRLAPEQLSLSLGPVLSPEVQEQLLAMQENAASYRTLTYLTAHH
ncbi:hypothetical protein FNT36_17495 [Hymenobacter setariae]|uniref:Uncharacterized protein n=1 Tax=Hymenobacter setariae TaxID=2594794 RepID=A0A558BSH1_9BACT|nr:hypothetical protein [Hymenobacter setariae]TVT39442.1 hypothetical protein FNT36_17495 [Hymenobacter setariae]